MTELNWVDDHATEALAASPRCLVVMYHYVHDPDRNRPGLSGQHPGINALSPEAFKRQIDHLCAIYEPIDWPTLYAWSLGRGKIPRRCFLPTFDDGLADHANIVLPILQRAGLRGVFFVPGVVMAELRMLSAHAVHLLLSVLGAERLATQIAASFRALGLEDPALTETESMSAASMYHYEKSDLAGLKYLLTMKLPAAVRSRVIDSLFERHIGSPSEWARRWYLSWDDLVRMQSLGHTIGGHGHLHEPYQRMSAAEVRRDMRDAARVLNDGLGPEVRPLSYPFGSVPPQASAACKAAGFVHGFTTEPAWLRIENDPARLPRFDTIAVDAALEEESKCPQLSST